MAPWGRGRAGHGPDPWTPSSGCSPKHLLPGTPAERGHAGALCPAPCSVTRAGCPLQRSPTEHVPAPQPALPPCHAPATWDEGTTAILIKQAGFERDPRCGLTPPARGRAGGRDAEVPPRAAALGRWAGAVCGLKAISTTPFPFFIYLTVINISQLRKQIERLNDTHKVTVQEKGGETPGFQLRVTSRPSLWGEAQW